MNFIQKLWARFNQFGQDSKDNDDINQWFTGLPVEEKRKIHNEHAKKVFPIYTAST